MAYQALPLFAVQCPTAYHSTGCDANILCDEGTESTTRDFFLSSFGKLSRLENLMQIRQEEWTYPFDLHFIDFRRKRGGSIGRVAASASCRSSLVIQRIIRGLPIPLRNGEQRLEADRWRMDVAAEAKRVVIIQRKCIAKYLRCYLIPFITTI